MGLMTPRAKKYLERARHCNEMADHTRAADTAALLRDLAVQWRTLAYRMEDERFSQFSGRVFQRERSSA
jgi:hypothetical protein